MIDWSIFLAILGAMAWALWCAARGERRRLRIAGATSAGLLTLGIVLCRDDLAMQKLVSWLSMPVGLLWLALLGLPLIALARGLRRLAFGGFVAAFAFTMLGNYWFSSWLATELEEGIPTAEDAFAAPPWDAILVVGGGAAWKGKSAELTDYGDRVMLGARLFRAHKVGALITTGSTIGGLSEYQDLTTATSTIWASLGVDAAAIIRIPEPKNTSQEIAALAAEQRAHGWHRVAVISSAWHLPRIAALAQKQGMKIDLIGADRRGGLPPFHPAYAVPTASAMRTSQLMAWETLGRLVGR